MLHFIVSPAGTALAVVLVLVLGVFAIRGIWAMDELKALRREPHLYLKLKEAKRRAARRKKRRGIFSFAGKDGWRP